MMLDFTLSVAMLSPSRSTLRGAPSGGVLQAGERERHLRAMEDATSSPGRTRAASPATIEPARSDHGQRHKGQDAALARRKAWGVTFHAHRPE